ncbi:hypothetical protein NPIL_138131, partial [Nephila pilipes]
MYVETELIVGIAVGMIFMFLLFFRAMKMTVQKAIMSADVLNPFVLEQKLSLPQMAK